MYVQGVIHSLPTVTTKVDTLKGEDGETIQYVLCAYLRSYDFFKEFLCSVINTYIFLENLHTQNS